MFKRHPIVTVLVIAALIYILVTAPMVVVEAGQALGALAGKTLDSIALALREALPK